MPWSHLKAHPHPHPQGCAVPGLPRAAAQMRCLAGLSLKGHHLSVVLQGALQGVLSGLGELK